MAEGKSWTGARQQAAGGREEGRATPPTCQLPTSRDTHSLHSHTHTHTDRRCRSGASRLGCIVVCPRPHRTQQPDLNAVENCHYSGPHGREHGHPGGLILWQGELEWIEGGIETFGSRQVCVSLPSQVSPTPPQQQEVPNKMNNIPPSS